MTTTLGERFSVASARQLRRVLGVITRPITRPITASVMAVAFATATLSPSVARADEVSPDGKGIAGGALLGAEIVTIPMSLFHVKSPWAYVIGGGLGAVGGGVAGYAIEQASFSNDGRVPTYMLAGGLALVIPAVVLILNATRYQPSDAASEDRAPTNSPPADPGRAGGSVVLEGGGSTQPAPAPAPSPTPAKPPSASPSQPPSVPMSLLDLHLNVNQRTGFRMGIPVPEVRESYSLAERKQFGVAQVTELRLPIFKATF